MKESDLENLSDINVRDTIDTRNSNSESVNKLKIDSSLVSNNLGNTDDELSKVPNCIKNYLHKNNCFLATFRNGQNYHEIKAALLQKTKFKSKDYNFTFNEQNDFYFFITKEYNPNYLKPITDSAFRRGKFAIKEKNENEKKEESKKINLNFDYNRYILKAVIIKKNNEEKLDVFCQIELNREVCQVSHTTPDSIEYYVNTKIIKPERAKDKFDNFALLIPEKYYLLEIETKKPANETIIKEDGILSVLYLITPKKSTTIDLFTMVKYSIYFSPETLSNYIGKYIHDMIYDFCHLPSECFDDFLSHIGSLICTMGSNYKLNFPLKKYIKVMENLSHKNLINHMYRNLPNITKPKAADRVPFHKFIFMYEKYKLYYAEKEFKIKQKYLNENEIKNKKYQFLKPSIINDPINDRITKEHKINLNVLIKTYFEILEKFLRENLSQEKSEIRNFLIENLSKFLVQYAAFKGFLNIDIVMNEDNMFEFQCTNNKKWNKKINNNMFGCVVNSLACINYIFGFNEGFFHKHFSIMDYSYNFNEKNVIHTFLCINDSSKKNKIRIYDIPFMDKWCYQLAGLLLTIYRDQFGFLCNKNYMKNQKKEINFHRNFSMLFSEIHENIIRDVEEYYKDVLPDYYKFCDKISLSPLDKYNCLDNLCQNFTNNSITFLIENSIIFFSPYDVVYNINDDELLNCPKLNSILEPYLILVDEELKKYLDKKEKKEKYLEEHHFDIKTFFKKLKAINIEKVHYSVFLAEKNEIEADEDEEEDLKENNIISTNLGETSNDNNETKKSDNNNEQTSEPIIDINEIYPKKMHFIPLKKVNDSKIQKDKFDFYYLFNLYYNFTYETMKEMKTIFVNYDIIRKYIASIESSVTISFNDYDKTIIKANAKKDLVDIKKIKKVTKKNIIKDLTIMSKLTRMTRHMNYIFSQYVNKIIKDIIKNPSSRIQQKNAQDEKYYIKIGHYIINFSAYEKNNEFFNEFDYFKKSDICKRLEDESHYLDSININH